MHLRTITWLQLSLFLRQVIIPKVSVGNKRVNGCVRNNGERWGG